MPDSGRTILVADADIAGTRRLAAAFRARGHAVLTVRDGSKALEVAVMRVPDVVIYDVDCPLIDSRTFTEILRANPRTAQIPILVVGPEGASERLRGEGREAFIQKPFNVDEVLGRVQRIFRRAEAADEVRREGAIEGRLGQLPISDLLQMLSLNRRSGALRLGSAEDSDETEPEGTIVLRDGRVVDAAVGEVYGVKAIHRLLRRTRGAFAFEPGHPSGAARIRLSTDELLLESMRQQDELAQLVGRAPGPDDFLAVAVDLANLPEGLHPVTEDVLGLIETYRRTGDVVDGCRASDLEVLRAITTLLERGLVKVLGRGVSEPEGRPLVGPEVAYALHGKLQRQRPGARVASLTVLVAASRASHLNSLLADLGKVSGWRPESDAAGREPPFGELGVLRLGDALELVLVALPADDSLTPLWRPFSAEAAGLVVVGEGEAGALLVQMVEMVASRTRPVAVVGHEPELLHAAGQAGFAAPSAIAAVARTLERLARQVPAR